jgi:hypothetical protein
MFEVSEDGKYTWITKGGNSDCELMNLSELRKLNREGFFSKFKSSFWVCWEFDSKGNRVGYKAGVFVSNDNPYSEIEICVKTAKGTPKIYKTIEAACADLISFGAANARIDFG